MRAGGQCPREPSIAIWHGRFGTGSFNEEHKRRYTVKLKPVGERALVKPVEQEETTASGIVLPDTAKERPQTGQVVAIGDSGEVMVSEGDLVLFAKYSGTEINLDGEDYLILDSDDLLGIVEA
jgi:chaperonin GroES